jgi:hypothetical protein
VALSLVPRVLTPALMILCLASGVGCGDLKKKPYDTSRTGVEQDQAAAFLRRQVERATPTESFSKTEAIETRTPSGVDAWLVRLVSDADSGDRCGYVWRGSEPGRADSTVLRVQLDPGCRHWAAAQ